MMAKAELFCGEPAKVIREAIAEYIVSDDQ
jgi:hypothetical protein